MGMAVESFRRGVQRTPADQPGQASSGMVDNSKFGRGVEIIPANQPRQEEMPSTVVNPALLWSALSQKDGKLRSANTEIARLDAAILKQDAELSSMHRSMEARDTELRGHLRSASHELMRLQAELTAKGKEQRLSADELAKAQREVQDKQNQLSQAGTELSRLVAAVDRYGGELKDAATQIVALRTQLEGKEVELREAHKVIELMKPDLMQHAVDVSNSNQNIAHLEQALLTQQGELEKAATEIAMMRVACKRSEEETSREKAEKLDIQHALALANSELFQKDTVIVEQGEQLQSLESLKRLLFEKERDHGLVNEDLAQVKSLMSQTSAELEKARQDVLHKQRELDAKISELETLQHEIVPLEALVETKTKDASSIEAELLRSQNSNNRKDSELLNAREELTRLRTLLEDRDKDFRLSDAELAHLQAELSSQDHTLRVTREELMEAQAILEYKGAELHKAQAEIGRLTWDRENNVDFARMKSEVMELRSKLDVNEAALHQKDQWFEDELRRKDHEMRIKEHEGAVAPLTRDKRKTKVGKEIIIRQSVFTEFQQRPTNIKAGTRLACIADVYDDSDGNDVADVYASPQDDAIIRICGPGEEVIAAADPVQVDGWWMVPIRPEGAVELQMFQIVQTSEEIGQDLVAELQDLRSKLAEAQAELQAKANQAHSEQDAPSSQAKKKGFFSGRFGKKGNKDPEPGSNPMTNTAGRSGSSRPASPSKEEPMTIEEMAAKVRAGTVLVCVQEDDDGHLELYAAPDSDDIIGSIDLGQEVEASGPAELIDDFWMLPIKPKGAVEMEHFKIVNVHEKFADKTREDLEASLQQKQSEASQLQVRLNSLQQQVESKDLQIEDLNKALASKDRQIDNLNKRLQKMSDDLDRSDPQHRSLSQDGVLEGDAPKISASEDLHVVADESVKTLGLSFRKGVFPPRVDKVNEGGWAEQVGILPDCVIKSINGEPTVGMSISELGPLMKSRPLALGFEMPPEQTEKVMKPDPAVEDEPFLEAGDENVAGLLVEAAAERDLEFVKDLCDRRADVNAMAESMTALHAAVSTGNLDCAQMLLRYRANINATDGGGMTPLYMSAAGGHSSILTYLCRDKADPNIAEDEGGATPLHVTAGQGNMGLVKILCSSKADVNLQDGSAVSPLMAVAAQGHTDIAKILVKGGADKEMTDSEGWTALYTASYCGHLQVVKVLVQAKADPKKKTNDDSTPLRAALTNGHKDVEKFLREAVRVK